MMAALFFLPSARASQPAEIAPMGTFGQRIKREREMRGVSLDEIAQATKIGTRSLRALEEEDFDRLPGGIFNKGFVRAYARFLGMDEEQAVGDYLVASGLEAPPAEAVETETAPSADLWRRRLKAIGIAALVLAAAGYGGWWLYSTGTRGASSQQESARPANPPAAATRPPPRASDEPAKVPALQPAAGAVSAGGSGTVAAASPAGASEFTVRIRARAECWVEITADGRREEVTLAAGGEKEIRALEKIEVKLGDASVVEIYHNGAALPPFAGERKVRALTFTREGVQP